MFLTAKSTYKKNRITSLRAYPLSFIIQRIIGTIFSLLFPIFTFYFVFNGQTNSMFDLKTNTTDYVLYITLGFSAYAVSVATLMNVGRSIISEIREGTLDTFLLSPASRIGYFLGCFLEQIGRTFIEFISIFIFGMLLGARITPLDILKLIICLIIVSTVSFSMSILLASIMIFTRDTFITQNTLFMLLAMITGVSFPINFLPNWLNFFSNIIPLTHALTFSRAFIMESFVSIDSFRLLFIILFESTCYFVIGYRWFISLEKKLIEDVYS
ncbi:ABC transporter permease [Enterococcus caccae]|uniref:Transport permease protein n=1 Tax=Enterococcus caccae ATCC BAA-1240 TaxID=1158612 RepID=R3TR97_9ENTE|nr:ABC transporter permease [Enterococcus caccae]EOL43663.1 hypothetical protein UC7_02993 [Enterococcus caccae ATCC BAA-1240]EOT67937.1 hypothetical protein I580_00319 [Enterococcus caccae ATCC BAA-1240]OJG28575.1 hypothetical protein RU98_GL000168 [Enterococcus caccae]